MWGCGHRTCSNYIERKNDEGKATNRYSKFNLNRWQCFSVYLYECCRYMTKPIHTTQHTHMYKIQLVGVVASGFTFSLCTFHPKFRKVIGTRKARIRIDRHTYSKVSTTHPSGSLRFHYNSLYLLFLLMWHTVQSHFGHSIRHLVIR